MSSRYTIKTKTTKRPQPGGARPREVTVWVVIDTTTDRVAKGTKGEGGTPGGYDTERDARRVARSMNRVQDELDQRKKRK